MSEREIDLEWLRSLEPNPEAQKFVRDEVEAGRVADLEERFTNVPDRAIGASFLEELILDENLPRQGVFAIRVIVLGKLNLEYANIEHRIYLQGCIFTEDVNFHSASVRSVLSFNGSTFMAEGDFSAIEVGEDLFINEVEFLGPANFSHADIGDQLSANKAKFLNEEVEVKFHGIKANSIFIKGALFLGQVDFGMAEIKFNLDAKPQEPKELAQPKVKSEFKGSAMFRTINVGGAVFVNEAQFHGQVDFAHARVGGSFEANGAQFLCKQGKANFNSLRVDGNAHFIEGVRFKGPADFTRLNVNGTVSFDNAIFYSTVTISGSRIGHQLGAKKASFLNKKNVADFRGINVDAGIFFQGATFECALNISDATLGAFVIEDLLVGEDGSVIPFLALERTVVSGILRLRSARLGLFAARDLKARTIELFDVTLHELGEPDLEGMTYDRISIWKKGAEDLEFFREFLERARYSRQPYQQMAQFFRQKGEVGSWRRILIDMHWRERGHKPLHGQLWNWIKYIFIGYGHRPWLVLLWALAVVFIGYYYAFTPSSIDPGSSHIVVNYGNRLLYSVSTLLPVVRLPIEKAWTVKPNASFAWTWAHIQPILGWLLAVFGVAGLTPWVK